MATKAFKQESTKIQQDQPEPASDTDEIAARAYALWQARGCPLGSDQEDWFRAEQELKQDKVSMEGTTPQTTFP